MNFPPRQNSLWTPDGEHQIPKAKQPFAGNTPLTQLFVVNFAIVPKKDKGREVPVSEVSVMTDVKSAKDKTVLIVVEGEPLVKDEQVREKQLDKFFTKLGNALKDVAKARLQGEKAKQEREENENDIPGDEEEGLVS